MNKVFLMGRLTRDPEIRHSSTADLTVARYTLAVERSFKREGEPEADFIDCVAFGSTADFVEKYLNKGKKILVTGHIQVSNYKNKDNQTVYRTNVIVENHEFTESKGGGTTDGASRNSAPAATMPNDFVNVPEDAEEDLPFT